MGARSGYGQISPGPLARAHQALDGPLACTKCHEFAAGREEFKCLACHVEIRQRLTERRGMHPIWTSGDATGKKCATCHSDHNGPDFPLVHWQGGTAGLDHRQTGFALTGRHAGLACAACHKAANIAPAARANIQVKDLDHSFLGLSRDCSTCHADVHRGQLGAACARCHTTEGWKPAAGFDHAATKFPLTGAHAGVDCAKCHSTTTDARPYVRYTGIAFGTCTACHADPHKGSFAGTCQSCHDTTSWVKVRRLTGFDHAKTAFPLEGKHVAVACSACHRRGNFSAPVAHARCADCHADAHRGQFAARPDRGDCASCHTVAGFTSSTFDVKAHAATGYPLDGRHARVECAACHKPKGTATVFKLANTRCAACHADVHKGQFANRKGGCEGCHTVQGFVPAMFTVNQHGENRFPLTGAHLAVPCAECHKTTTAPGKYVFDDRSCAVCHADPHRGQFRARMAALKADGSPEGCEACHETDRWTVLRRFDHSTTRFPLLGAHRGVACADCHRPPNLETTMRAVGYRDAPKACAGCHEDPHGGQFAARKDVTGCESCHDASRWKPADFDHDRRTTFALSGAHRRVACASCHTRTRSENGGRVVVYAPTPSACEACHG